MSLGHQPIRRAGSMAAMRPLFAILVGLAMLFAPLAVQGSAAMAMAPADHHQMMDSGRCGEQPAKSQKGKADKGCCVALCAATSVASAVALEPYVPERGVDQPGLTQFRRSFLAELPTPPPRLA